MGFSYLEYLRWRPVDKNTKTKGAEGIGDFINGPGLWTKKEQTHLQEPLKKEPKSQRC